MSKRKTIDEIIKDAGIRLDIGGGDTPQPGFINMDYRDLPSVDIVWDIEETPWPLPDESVSMAMASHVLEHINPHKGVFINVMDEIWRVLKPGARFAFVVPHAESPLMHQDPTHCNFINEATMTYFDPLHPSGMYLFYRPKPWKIIQQPFSRMGILECLLEKRPMDKSYLQGSQNPQDITQERFDVRPIRTDY